MMIGYARVSTVQQDTALQREAFTRAGVRRVIEEKRSGGGVARPLLDELLSKLKAGDVLVVYKIDRLARSLVDLLKILQRVTDAGATFKSLTEPLETSTPVGRMMIQLLGAVAEFEKAVIHERCEGGRIAARARGVRFGSPPRVVQADVCRMLDRGHSRRDVASHYGITEETVRRVISGIRVCDGGPGEHSTKNRRACR
jgi:DNA invertase Pin-like site-specific DNA recombinase